MLRDAAGAPGDAASLHIDKTSSPANGSGNQFGSDLGRYRALFNGARAGDVDIVSSLLGEGLLVNCSGPRGATPLHIAARFGQPQVVSLLISQKADPAAKDDRGHTPLDKARATGVEEIMQQLQAALVPRTFDSRCRKLLEAAHRGDVARLRELCDSQEDLVRQRGPRGATALHVAARYGHVEAVEVLLDLGAEVAAADNNGHTATDKARQLKHERVLAVLAAAAAAAPAAASSDARPATTTPIAASLVAAADLADSLEPGHIAHQDTLRPRDATKPDAPPRPIDELALQAGLHEVVLWEEGAAGLESLPEVRPLRDGEVVWLMGQGGAALNCCMPLRAAEHTAESPLHIGRARTCTLSLNDQEVSGTHAALWWAEGGVVVADKPGSFNGTFLRLSSDREPSAAYALRPGDTFGLGCVGPGGLGHWLTLLSQDGGDFLQVRNTKEQGSQPHDEALPGDGAPFGMGRAPSNALVLKDQAVSACHAQLTRASASGAAGSSGVAEGEGGEAWRVADLGSSNGTCVRLSPERTASRPFRLCPGHSLLLGLGPKCSELSLGRFRAGVGAWRGRRPSMEDAHVALEALPAPAGWGGAAWPLLSFYAVYDGHGGHEAAEFAKAHLHRHLLRHLAERRASQRADAGGTGGGESGSGGGGSSGEGGPSTEELAGAMRAAFLSVDAQFLETTASCAGSTAVCALVTPSHVIVGNAGDSRAYVWRERRALRMTCARPRLKPQTSRWAPEKQLLTNLRVACRPSVDHKPDRADETARITAAGGWVSNGRVMHTLAVSRALGDRDFKVFPSSDSSLPWKESLVTAEPEVRICRAQEGDELLLACDGLWDVLSPEAAFDYLHAKKVGSTPRHAVQQLVRAADEEYNSSDNVSVVYAHL